MSPAGSIAGAGKRPLPIERLIAYTDAPADRSSGAGAVAPEVLEGELIVAEAPTPPLLVATSFDAVPVYSRAAAIRYYQAMQSVAAQPSPLCNVTV